ncbi:MAG: hypothetical protein K0M40_03695 [Prolixibacteraceae bacterium]|nr:hypothetical protein [Prolixibacteraceae bacterium]
MEKLEFTREELYNLVWSEPLSRLAKKYNMSDNGIRKICKKINIPLPAIGHWQKVQYGYKVIQPKLPEKFTGNNIIKLDYRKEDGSHVEPGQSPKSILKQEILKNQKIPFIVPERLSNPDPLIIQAQNTLVIEKRKSFNFKGVVETKSGELNIRVAPSNVGRTLRFMDTFIKLLRSRNHDITRKNGVVCALIYGEEIEFCIREKIKITYTQEKYPTREYHPNGILSFIIGRYNTKEWKEGKQLLEEKITDILIYLELKCKKRQEERIEDELKRQIQLEAEQKRKELLARRQAELYAVEDLLNQAIRLQQAKFMRDYVDFVSQNAENNITQNTELSDWISWAKHKIDWYDPLIQVDDDLLDDDDRKTLVERLRKK